MTGTPAVVWKKLDPHELRQRLMGHGEPAMNNDEPKPKVGGKGIFQTRSRKRMSTAPGSTLPRPSLGDLAISPPISVTKQPIFTSNQITATQSYADLSFDRKRVMRRSRSAQGLVGPFSEYKMDMKIKRKPVPRLSGQSPIRSEPLVSQSEGKHHHETLSHTTGSYGRLLQGFHDTGQISGTLNPPSAQLDTDPFFTFTSHTLPKITYVDSSAPTIPTTFTSGSLNLGLISSGSRSSLTPSDTIDTPTKRPTSYSRASDELNTGSSLSSRRYGSFGMNLNQYMGDMRSEEDKEDCFGAGMEEAERDEVLRPTIRISASSTEEDNTISGQQDQATITSRSLGLLHGSAQSPPSASAPPRPARSPGLYLDLSHLRPFASTLLLASPASCDEAETPTSGSVRLNMASRVSDHPDYTASSESSFAALRKDSLDSPFIRSFGSSIGKSGGEGVGWQAARSHLGNEVEYRSDTEEESEGTKTAVLSAEALAALDETPKASFREDPFLTRPTYQQEDTVREWTNTLRSTTGTPIRPDAYISMVQDAEAISITSPDLSHSQKHFVEQMKPDNVIRSNRGNRAERLMEDGRASRTGYWDYSIIRGGYATPPPPEFFSTFQNSPRTPTFGKEATFQNQHHSPGKPLHSSPLQTRTDANEMREAEDEDEEFDHTKNRYMLTPEKHNERRASMGSQAMTTPQHLLKYGMDVLTSPVKLLSPRTRPENTGNREESSGLLEHAQGMGRRDRQYSSPSEYDVDDSPMSRYEGFETGPNGTPFSMPLFEIKYTGDLDERTATPKSLSSGIGSRNSFGKDHAEARPSVSDRLREISVAVSGSSKLDSLSHLDIDLLPPEQGAIAIGTQVAQFNNAPPVFHFPSPPPSDRHQSIFSMLSGSSGSQSTPRGSQAALLAAQMNEARRQQRQEHLIVLEPAVDIINRSGHTAKQKLGDSQVDKEAHSSPNDPQSGPSSSESISPSELFVIRTPPPKKRCSAFADAESPDIKGTIDSPPSKSHTLTPQRISSSATIAAHGPAISIISPDRNFPRLKSNIQHDSPQSLPLASSRRDIPNYPKDTSNDTSSSTTLLPVSDRSSLQRVIKSHSSSTYRDDIRLRPLHAILHDDKAKNGNSQHSFTASSQQSEQEDDMLATQARWDDVYCACFGRRIC